MIVRLPATSASALIANALVAFAFVGVGLGMSGGTMVAHAGDTQLFGASPTGGRSGFNVPRGGVLRDTLAVRNHSKQALTLTIYAAGATIGSDGVVSVGYAHQQRSGLSAKVAIAARVAVPAGKEVVVPFTVDARGLDARGLSQNSVADLAALVVQNATARPAGGLQLVERVAVMLRPVAAVAAPATEAANGSRPAGDGVPGLPTWWFIGLFVAGGAVIFGPLRKRRANVAQHAAASFEGRERSGEWSHAAPVTSIAPARCLRTGKRDRPVAVTRADGTITPKVSR